MRIQNLKNNKKFVFGSFIALLSVSISLILIVNANYNKEKENTFDIKYLQDEDLGFQTFGFIEEELALRESTKIQELTVARHNERVAKVENIFSKYGGYLSGYGDLLVTRTEECGGDYRIIAAIAGNESGFGRINYKLYNPFGYLDGVQYESFEHAIHTISCKISQRFIIPCNGDLNCIVRTYAGPQDDKNQWVKNITFFMNQL